MRIALALIGFGHVARRYVRLLDESRAALDALGIEPVVVGIATARHGAVWNDAGFDRMTLGRLADLVASGQPVGPDGNTSRRPAAIEIIERLGRRGQHRSEARVMVETTVLNVQSGEPAVSHIRAAFAAGAHVISANKGPVACAYRALADEAAARGLGFFFEGAVMDGLPIFNLVRETLPAVEIHGFRGVINSTTNHILCAMERGEDFAAALTKMQAAGVAEADPSLDIDGWDAAAKVAAMANVWMDARVTPAAVARQGLTPASASTARAALAAGRRLKLVGAARRDGTGRPRLAVTLETLEASDPLAILDDQANALELDTTPLGRFVITQRDGGLEKTAYALVTDLVAVARHVSAAR